MSGRKNKHGINVITGEIDERSFSSGLKSIPPFKPKNERQSEGYHKLYGNVINFILGKVGTGKTWISVRYALEMLKQRKIKRIVVLRANLPASEEYGFFKGSLEDKIAPYLQSMLLPMEEMIGKQELNSLLEREIIKMGAIGLQRGITYSDSIILVDEIQNLTPEQLRLTLDRIGINTQVVLMGDSTQKDLPVDRFSCIDDLERFIGKKHIEFTIFEDKDIVRSNIVKIIEKCYDKDELQINDYEKYGHLVYPEEVATREIYSSNKY